MMTATTPSTLLYIVRHGQSEGNAQNIIQGHFDSPLSTEGELQAVAMARALEPVRFAAVFSSDSMRAQQTAEIIAATQRLEITTSTLLREHFMGQWEGRAESDYRAEHREQLAQYERLSEQEKWTSKIPDDVESDAEVLVRFLQFVRDAVIVNPGKTMLLATHGGVMRCLLVHAGLGDARRIAGAVRAEYGVDPMHHRRH